MGEGASEFAGSNVGTGLRKDVRDLAEPVGEVRGEVGIPEGGGVESRGSEGAAVGGASGVEGAVLNEETDSLDCR